MQVGSVMIYLSLAFLFYFRTSEKINNTKPSFVALCVAGISALPSSIYLHLALAINEKQWWTGAEIEKVCTSAECDVINFMFPYCLYQG